MPEIVFNYKSSSLLAPSILKGSENPSLFYYIFINSYLKSFPKNT